MVRLLYISGMVFFAVLIGDSANRLQDLYNAGILFDQYNGQRKADITLLIVSSFGLAALCAIEVIRLRRRFADPDVAEPLVEDPKPVAEEGDPDDANIYSAPHTVDAWQERPPLRTVVKQSRRQARHQSLNTLDMSGLWMRLLRIYSGVLPVVYFYTLVNYLFLWLPGGAGSVELSILFPFLFLGSVLTAVGILRKRIWGMKFGYAMAIFHLLIFPVGTVAGFVMLIGLMGATSQFTDPNPRNQRANRKTRRKRLQSATV